MPNDEISSIQNRKRKMAKRFIELRDQLSAITVEELMLIRTSDLEEYGKLLKKVIEYKDSLKK